MYSNLLIPLAVQEDRDPAAAIAVARALSAPGARVTFLHVMDEIPAYAINYMPSGWRDDLRHGVEEELDDLAATLPNAVGRVAEGAPGRTILSWAADHGVDCIVIASHRPTLQDYFIGSTAAHVVRHGRCAVHVMR